MQFKSIQSLLFLCVLSLVSASPVVSTEPIAVTSPVDVGVSEIAMAERRGRGGRGVRGGGGSGFRDEGFRRKSRDFEGHERERKRTWERESGTDESRSRDTSGRSRESEGHRRSGWREGRGRGGGRGF